MLVLIPMFFRTTGVESGLFIVVRNVSVLDIHGLPLKRKKTKTKNNECVAN